MRHQWEDDPTSKATYKGRERSTCRRCTLERRRLGPRLTYYRQGDFVGELAGVCAVPDDVDAVEGIT